VGEALISARLGPTAAVRRSPSLTVLPHQPQPQVSTFQTGQVVQSDSLTLQTVPMPDEGVVLPVTRSASQVHLETLPPPQIPVMVEQAQIVTSADANGRQPAGAPQSNWVQMTARPGHHELVRQPSARIMQRVPSRSPNRSDGRLHNAAAQNVISEFVSIKTDVARVPIIEKQVHLFDGRLGTLENQLAAIQAGIGMVEKRDHPPLNHSRSFTQIRESSAGPPRRSRPGSDSNVADVRTNEAFRDKMQNLKINEDKYKELSRKPEDSLSVQEWVQVTFFKKFRELQNEVTDLKQDAEKMSTKLDSSHAMTKTLQTDKMNLESSLKAEKATFAEKQQELAEQVRRAEGKTAEIAAAKSEVERKYDALMKEKNDLERNLTVMNKKHQEQTNALTECQSKKEELAQKQNELVDKNIKLSGDISNWKSTWKNETTKHVEDNKVLIAQLDEKNKENQLLKSQSQDIVAQYQELEQQHKVFAESKNAELFEANRQLRQAQWSSASPAPTEWIKMARSREGDQNLSRQLAEEKKKNQEISTVNKELELRNQALYNNLASDPAVLDRVHSELEDLRRRAGLRA
jgi:hypothetical protein